MSHSESILNPELVLDPDFDLTSHKPIICADPEGW